jgi:hypothetical protein
MVSGPPCAQVANGSSEWCGSEDLQCMGCHRRSNGQEVRRRAAAAAEIFPLPAPSLMAELAQRARVSSSSGSSSSGGARDGDAFGLSAAMVLAVGWQIARTRLGCGTCPEVGTRYRTCWLGCTRAAVSPLERWAELDADANAALVRAGRHQLTSCSPGWSERSPAHKDTDGERWARRLWRAADGLALEASAYWETPAVAAAVDGTARAVLLAFLVDGDEHFRYFALGKD